MRLEGHTDQIGDEASNLKLSRDRVIIVKNYLSLKGVASDRIEIAYLGSQRPV
ncbi:hypothetical protein C5O19_18630 [Siphonobacter curvatus]|uniref:OmpA-like domain-containing protein n=1 Tax=Siphonobacter curvatus TaxID=2094562 RepID=A0A2S7IJB6_9BACT|nr:hypothetical protein C5O19_18630 [Siphonobacter curvatus]